MKVPEQKKENRFQIDELEERIAPTGAAMTTTKLNPAGNEPHGVANGQAITTVVHNPAGNQPPGQQP
jgi:hypothetical protein